MYVIVDDLTMDWVAVLYYDYALTAIPEVNYFWRGGNLNVLVSTLFALNRCLGVVGSVPVIFEYFGDHGPAVSENQDTACACC